MKGCPQQVLGGHADFYPAAGSLPVIVAATCLLPDSYGLRNVNRFRWGDCIITPVESTGSQDPERSLALS